MSNGNIRVAVVGAAGKMGREVVRTVVREEGLELVGAVGTRPAPDAGVVAGIGEIGVPLSDNLQEVLVNRKPDVLVDFTRPDAAVHHVEAALALGVRPVVGTTGIPGESIRRWDAICREQNIGGLVAPNFAIGAVLMMRFAKEAARFFPHVEIVEMHHDRKLDAPSGTAVKTAEEIVSSGAPIRSGRPDEKELRPGARGADVGGVRIHSVRLPGFVAHQEIFFGGMGQVLTIRHDAVDRQCFMPGVVMAVRAVMTYTGMLYGLEPLLR
ncbi:MAG: 4-hydroxy-tetrahydrodipicolinate reductase [Alicyclobacillaceae bacterium]|nr:4-hydroxy-tetrahydrodipicolinate reductase [Alicyclobacillaceae bacterium]